MVRVMLGYLVLVLLRLNFGLGVRVHIAIGSLFKPYLYLSLLFVPVPLLYVSSVCVYILCPYLFVFRAV
jgi:hypothetical protein